MSNEWFDRLSQLAQSAGATLVIRSAVNPLLWLCGVICPPYWAAAYLLRANPFIARFLVVLSAVPVLTTCGVVVYFAVRKPERL